MPGRMAIEGSQLFEEECTRLVGVAHSVDISQKSEGWRLHKEVVNPMASLDDLATVVALAGHPEIASVLVDVHQRLWMSLDPQDMKAFDSSIPDSWKQSKEIFLKKWRDLETNISLLHPALFQTTVPDLWRLYQLGEDWVHGLGDTGNIILSGRKVLRTWSGEGEFGNIQSPWEGNVLFSIKNAESKRKREGMWATVPVPDKKPYEFDALPRELVEAYEQYVALRASFGKNLVDGSDDAIRVLQKKLQVEGLYLKLNAEHMCEVSKSL